MLFKGLITPGGGFSAALTDLAAVWTEHLAPKECASRFRSLNPRTALATSPLTPDGDFGEAVAECVAEFTQQRPPSSKASCVVGAVDATLARYPEVGRPPSSGRLVSFTTFSKGFKTVHVLKLGAGSAADVRTHLVLPLINLAAKAGGIATTSLSDRAQAVFGPTPSTRRGQYGYAEAVADVLAAESTDKSSPARTSDHCEIDSNEPSDHCEIDSNERDSQPAAPPSATNPCERLKMVADVTEEVATSKAAKAVSEATVRKKKRARFLL